MLRALALASSAAALGATTISVDASSSWGAWQGFGVSLAWAGNVFGGRGDLADALFTTLDRVDLSGGVDVPALPVLRR